MVSIRIFLYNLLLLVLHEKRKRDLAGTLMVLFPGKRKIKPLQTAKAGTLLARLEGHARPCIS